MVTLVETRCAHCESSPCICRRQVEERPCVCGGTIEAVPHDPSPGVARHNRTTRHQAWRLKR